jgi:hypothetical protein
MLSHFMDNSGRHEYVITGTFRSVPSDQWDSDTFN